MKIEVTIEVYEAIKRIMLLMEVKSD